MRNEQASNLLLPAVFGDVIIPTVYNSSVTEETSAQTKNIIYPLLPLTNLIIITIIIMSNLIVEFPSFDRRNHRMMQAVRFADTVEVSVVQRHVDNEEHKVDRQELWYTKADYRRMKLDVKRDVLEVRANASAGAPFRYSGDDDDADESSGGSSSSSVCCIGIEHLLTPACVLGVKTCRARCKQAVFSELARQSPSARYSWEGTALASIAQTRKPALRARILGKLHRDSI